MIKVKRLVFLLKDNVLSDRIVEHLTDPFKTIAENYDRNYSTITLSTLLDEITRVYIRNIKNINKVTVPTKSHLPRVDTKTSNHTKSKTDVKGKNKRLFHLQEVNPETEVETLRQQL